MFKFLSGLFLPKPVFNPALGDLLATILLKESMAGKLTTAFDAIAPIRTGDWDRRAFYAELAGRYFSQPESLLSTPDNSLGNLIRGYHYIHAAWAARGGGQADSVTNQGWISFFDKLGMARAALERSAEQDADDPSPLAALQTVGMGLQLDRTVTDEWFVEAISRDPFNQQAHFRKLFALCQKWSGSHDEMYSFARQTMSKLPDTSTLHSLIYLAYQEHFLYLAHFDKNPDGARALPRNSNIRTESIAVYERSFGRRPTITSVADYWPHNVAAWWFMMMDKKEQARQEAKKIGRNFTEYPWLIFYVPPTKGYQKFLRFTR